MTEVGEYLVPLILALAAVVSYRLLRAKKTVPYPPGPSPKPIIGNALDIPLEKAWIKYIEWSKEFNNNIIHLTAMNTHIVVLNSLEDITELMERKSANYSSRPSLTLFKILGLDVTTGCLSYGNTLKKHRRVMEEALKKDALPSYHNMFTKKVFILLDRFLHDPESFREHCLMLGASVTMAIAYGYDVVPGAEDCFIENAQFAANTGADLAIPGRTLLAGFGLLCYIPPWVPGASTQKLCLKVKEAIMQTREGPYQYVKQQMMDGTAKDCVLVRQLERDSGNQSREDEELLKDIMATFYFGGVETMDATMANFILAMAVHPDTQRRAQEEIDRIVGSHRLPSFDDRPSLPYVEALYREVHRWRPVFPVGLPHATASDDEYKGYYIPKGTMVVPNVWAVTRNEDKYTDPDEFKPERFFIANGTLNDDTVGYSFGFGRRVCPGRHMANKMVWLMICSVLATFQITKAYDENGNEIDIDANAYTVGLTAHPLPFKCSITPRLSQTESLIRSAAATALHNLTRKE